MRILALQTFLLFVQSYIASSPLPPQSTIPILQGHKIYTYVPAINNNYKAYEELYPPSESRFKRRKDADYFTSGAMVRKIPLRSDG